jgi:nascent polypeptide-associated complex subunit alpha
VIRLSRVNSRRARRMMKQMGLKMDELGDIERVILQGKKREIVIEGPAVTAINMQGQKMYQVAGGTVTEKALEAKVEIPEEDVLLVAQQANVSMERARAALEDAEGDLAKAILVLSTG